MARLQIDEHAAFELLREQSRRSGRKLVDVALAVLNGHALLPSRAATDGAVIEPPRVPGR